MLVAITLSIITILVCLVQTTAFRRLYRYVGSELARTPAEYSPKATVILPCKGLDPGFDLNISQLLKQDYANFSVIFAVCSEDDPAYSRLVDLCRTAAVPAKIVVAGVNPFRAQKVNNQLKALQELSDDTEVLVFVDSDMIAGQNFLSCLIAPLAEESVGVTTGYRFYISSIDNWPGQLRSLWNRMSAWELANPKYSFAWGGAMAIRRSVFDRAQVVKAWDRSCDDDLALTTAVKKLGLRVHFVPQCLVASEGDAKLAEIIEWTNRQLILTKVYYPQLWERAIGRACVMAVWLLAMLSAVSGWVVTRDVWLGVATLAGLAIIPLELIFMKRARSLWQRVLKERAPDIQESFVSSCSAILLAHLVLPWITLFSVFTNRIQWRGVTYELRSPEETVVLKSSSMAS